MESAFLMKASRVLNGGGLADGFRKKAMAITIYVIIFEVGQSSIAF